MHEISSFHWFILSKIISKALLVEGPSACNSVCQFNSSWLNVPAELFKGFKRIKHCKYIIVLFQFFPIPMTDLMIILNYPFLLSFITI